MTYYDDSSYNSCLYMTDGLYVIDVDADVDKTNIAQAVL